MDYIIIRKSFEFNNYLIMIKVFYIYKYKYIFYFNYIYVVKLIKKYNYNILTIISLFNWNMFKYYFTILNILLYINN